MSKFLLQFTGSRKVLEKMPARYCDVNLVNCDYSQHY